MREGQGDDRNPLCSQALGEPPGPSRTWVSLARPRWNFLTNMSICSTDGRWKTQNDLSYSRSFSLCTESMKKEGVVCYLSRAVESTGTRKFKWTSPCVST